MAAETSIRQRWSNGIQKVTSLGFQVASCIWGLGQMAPTRFGLVQYGCLSSYLDPSSHAQARAQGRLRSGAACRHYRRPAGACEVATGSKHADKRKDAEGMLEELKVDGGYETQGRSWT